MTLADVVGGAHLAPYAVVALIAFMVALGSILIWTFAPQRSDEYARARTLPLDDGSVAPAFPPNQEGLP